jgi:cytidylate kinase
MVSGPVSILIAVDGPAASGKGSIARALAAHYQLPHMDTGLLYRAAALTLVRFGGDLASEFEAVRACAGVAQVDPIDPELRSEIVGEVASRISAYPAVRAALLDRQRAFAAQPGGAVLDGRDIGTVIAPYADAKLFITADPQVRAQRRLAELLARGMDAHFEEVLGDIAARDARDSGRDSAPLQRAPDAMLLDTSALGLDEAIAAAIALVDKRLSSTR